MRVLLLGVGMQGKAALHDLVRSRAVDKVIAADRETGALEDHIKAEGLESRVRAEYVDTEEPASIDRLMSREIDVAVSLVPASCQTNVARSAVKHGVHLVHASYVTEAVKDLHADAVARKVTILPEFGMDPGLDLLCLGEAARSLESVEEIRTYGAGFPDPSAAGPPIGYKLTWNFEGVLKSYYRPARMIRHGQVVDIQAPDLFHNAFIHTLEIENLGTLEAFPNGDALHCVNLLNIEPAGLRHAGRYVLRWPGHAAFWGKMADLHLLDHDPVEVDGVPVDRKRFLSAAMAPYLQYGRDERDVVVVRVEVRGMKKGKKKRILFQIVDRRDTDTGLYAMNRTVGFTASIGALMIGMGRITRRGVLSPLRDIPFAPFTKALAERRIRMTHMVSD